MSQLRDRIRQLEAAHALGNLPTMLQVRRPPQLWFQTSYRQHAYFLVSSILTRKATFGQKALPPSPASSMRC